MITIEQCRDRDGEHFPDEPRQEEKLKALSRMVEVDLLWGASIKEITPTRIVTITRVLACVDTAIYTGSEEEMYPLVECVYYYLKAAEQEDQVMDAVMQELDSWPRQIGRRPFYLMAAGGMVIGNKRMQMALMMAMGITDPAETQAGLHMPVKDLFAVFELMRDCPGVSFMEMLAEVTPAQAA